LSDKILIFYLRYYRWIIWWTDYCAHFNYF